MHALAIQDIRRETSDTVSIAFDVPDELKADFSFESGQYLTLEAMIDGEAVRRSYSLCSAPGEDEWRVAVKKVPNGKFSTYANEVLTQSSVLSVMPPMGSFRLSTDVSHSNHYVAFAAGSGITPIFSMLKSVLSEEPESRFTLFYGNKNAESIIFRQELEDLKNQHMDRIAVHYVMSREKLGSPLFLGRINAEKCKRFGQVFFDPKTVEGFYLCGPSKMIFDVKDALVEMGTPAEQVNFELFNTDDLPVQAIEQVTEAPFDPATESKVTVILDGDSFDFTLPYGGQSILDAALAEGADLPFACKGGVCCTCKAKVDEGTTHMDVNYTLEPDEISAGFVLTCQAHPRTPRTIVNFDEA